MRILFVTPYVPSRIRVRPYNLIKALSKYHDIFLISLLVDEYERDLLKDVEPYCAAIDVIQLSKREAYGNCLRALCSSVPLRVAYYRTATFTEHIIAAIQTHAIDVVHGELIKTVPALQALRTRTAIPILFDAVDCISWFLQQQVATSTNLLHKTFTYSELLKMRHFERHALSGFDQLIITSATDQNVLNQLMGGEQTIHVIPNCVDTDYFTPQPCTRQAATLVFCAKLDYAPNAQAISAFCKQALPLIWEQKPEVKLMIVGNNPPPAVRVLNADKRITVTGYVPDIRPYLAQATIAIAPLLVAAGTQFKILEALAMATPLVTTPRCSQALGTKDGYHLLEAEDAQRCATKVIQLLNDPQYAQKLGLAGRQFVSETYSWQQSAHVLSELYQALCSDIDKRELIASISYQSRQSHNSL